jgi:hypothetical protein
MKTLRDTVYPAETPCAVTSEIQLGSHLMLRPMLPLLLAVAVSAALAAALAVAAWRWPLALARPRRTLLTVLRVLIVVAVAMLLLRPEVRWMGEKPLTTEVAFLVDGTRSMAIRDALVPEDVRLLDDDQKQGTVIPSERSEPTSPAVAGYVAREGGSRNLAVDVTAKRNPSENPAATVAASRIDAVRYYFLTAGQPYADLGGRCLINAYAFGTRVRPMGGFNPEATDPRTDIAQALGFMLARLDAQETGERGRAAGTSIKQDNTMLSSATMAMRLASVVLISDGQANRAHGSAEEIARRLAARGVTVHTVAVGSGQPTDRVRDVAVRDLRAPARVFVGNRPEVRVTVAALGMAGRSVPLVLEVDGKEIERRPVAVKSNQESQEIVFRPTLDRVGLARLALSVEPVAGELVTTNNRAETGVRVEEGGLRVLYLDGQVRPEGKYIARALGDAREMLLERRILVGRRATEGAPTPADIDAASVVILGDLPASALPPETIARIVARAREGRLGVLTLGGLSSLGAGGWAATPLAEVLPVAIRDGQGLAAGPIRFQPTAAGRQHFIFSMDGVAGDGGGVAPSPGASTAAGLLPDFMNLPPLPGASTVGSLHPTARLLAQTPDGRTLLAIREFARGRVATLTPDATWQWILMADSPRGQDQHRRFWRQLVLWLAGRDARPQAAFWVATDRPRYMIMDADNPPVAEVTVRAPAGVVPRLRMTGQRQANVELSPASNVVTSPPRYGGASIASNSAASPAPQVDWRGTIPLTQAGAFTLTAEADGKGAAQRAETVFSVEEQNLELADILADPEALRRIAEAGGGTFRQVDDLRTLLTTLAAEIKPRYEPAPERQPLAEGRAFLGVVLGLLALDWALRRKWRVA